MEQRNKKQQDTQSGANGTPGINYLAAHPELAQTDAIDAELEALNAEWDQQQTIALSTAVLGIAGTVLGMMVNKKWLALPILTAAFLAQYSIQGWSPMVPLAQKFGFRKRHEIERRKYALKAQRGDFRRTANNADRAWKAVNS
jgi:hypothetical protein